MENNRIMYVCVRMEHLMKTYNGEDVQKANIYELFFNEILSYIKLL